MNAAEKLKKIIREEVRRAVRQEISKVLNENRVQQSSYASSLESQVKNKIPSNLNPPNPNKIQKTKFDKSNPFAQMLNETALSFASEDARGFMGTNQISPVDYFQPQEAKVGGVDDMLASARKSSNIDMVQIDTVPDFSALMNKMKQNGQI